jgi:hypothetical protein
MRGTATGIQGSDACFLVLVQSCCRAQRLCRHMLNIVASVPALLDSHDVSTKPSRGWSTPWGWCYLPGCIESLRSWLHATMQLPHLRMLAAFEDRLHLVVEQLALALEGLASMVRCEHPPSRQAALLRTPVSCCQCLMTLYTAYQVSLPLFRAGQLSSLPDALQGSEAGPCA